MENKQKWAIIRAERAAGAGESRPPAVPSVTEEEIRLRELAKKKEQREAKKAAEKAAKEAAKAAAPKKPRGRPKAVKAVEPPPPVVVPDDAAALWETLKSLAEEVYRDLGAGHTESVYHNAMKVGLHDSRLAFETERDLPINFRGRYVGTARADLVVEGRIVVELKITGKLEDAADQCRQYMVLTGIRCGMVILFPKDGGAGVQIRSVA